MKDDALLDDDPVRTARLGRLKRRAAVPEIFRPKLWLLDLDDTVLGSSRGLLHAIHLRMNAFITERLGLPEAQAEALRTQYWEEYGSTFLGMWLRHGVDPREFLPATHDFDFAPYVSCEGDPKQALKKLPGRKVVFTNGPRNYADAVLKAMGMSEFFDAEVTSTEMRLFGDWRPKPNTSMFAATCARFGVSPRETVFVDDSPMNLKAAARTGLTTVWCTGYRRVAGKLPWRKPYPYIDHVVGHVRELPKLFGTCGASNGRHEHRELV